MNVHRDTVAILLCLILVLLSACSTSDDDDAARQTADDDDDGSSLFDGDGDVEPSDFTGVWTGSMDIQPYSGQGGGIAPIELVIDVADDGTFTGTFTDPSCPDDPACPDHEAVTGALNFEAVTITFSFIFACGTDGITYDYRMIGDLLSLDEMAGDFDAFDDVGTPLSQGTWALGR